MTRNYKTYTDEDLIGAVKTSKSIRNVLRIIGLNEAGGGNYKTVRQKIQELKLDVSHFTGQGHLKGKRHGWAVTTPLEEILVKDTTWRGNNSRLKPRLYTAGILEEKCYIDICPIKGPVWCEQYIALHLDHINGDHRDYRPENLRVLCPNCHSQTDTYCGKNKGAYSNYGPP